MSVVGFDSVVGCRGRWLLECVFCVCLFLFVAVLGFGCRASPVSVTALSSGGSVAVAEQFYSY